MNIEIKSGLLSSIFIILLLHISYFANVNAETIWDGESTVSVSIVGNSIINLDSNNQLLRAYVDIENHDPSDGYYFLRIIQPGTDKIISEEEIIITKKSNGKAGADVAHMFNEEEISDNGPVVLGDYTLEVFSEKGTAIGTTTFSIIKPSESNVAYVSKAVEDIDTSSDTESVEEQPVLANSELVNAKQIPEWVKNIFILYADDKITENELISALKFLIEQEIIKVN